MKILQKYRQYKKRQSFYKRDSKFINLHSLENISKKELFEIKKIWPYFDIHEKDLIYSMMYKKENGFSPYFINDYQFGYILEKTNPYKQVVSLANKGMIDIYFDELPLPQIIIKKIANVFYDNKMNIISNNDAVNILLNHKEFVIKPSVETGCGKGVKVIELDLSNDNSKYINELLWNYGKNFVVQEKLYQCKDFARLNPSSVNCFRVTSIFINGKFDFSTILKVGKNGAKVDNWNNGYLIGVNKDGTLKEFGYDNNLNKIHSTDNGIIFGGIKINNYENIIQFVHKYHIKYFPNCGIVGWDIMIDKNNNIRVIEVNLDYPGVVGEQLCSGTFFENYINEINNLFKK